jgi:hypothetical protein
MYPQVFRTYNASITLDRLLSEMEEADEDAYAAKTVDAKKADYDRANKEVRCRLSTYCMLCVAAAAVCNQHSRCLCSHRSCMCSQGTAYGLQEA